MEWSISKLSILRQCHRKFFFAYEISNFHFTHPIRRKAFELSQSKNLNMWQGDLIDKAFSNIIINLYQQKQSPDFNKIANDVINIAKKQFEFSANQIYHKKGISKTKAGDTFQILNVHECGIPYQEQDIQRIYFEVKNIILKIPEYCSPVQGKTLHEYLLSSSYLIPNQQRWSYEFEGVRLNPQIDLIRFNNHSIDIIDWKVSDSSYSDYSKQLYIAGIVSYHNIKKSYLTKGWVPPKMKDISLFEINLLNGNFKQYPFTKESTAATLDYIYMFKDEQEQLSGNKKWNELNIEDYETTDKKETCFFCKFKILCIHLIKNNLIYNEKEYYKLVQTQQLC